MKECAALTMALEILVASRDESGNRTEWEEIY
jgi:hypothetical protein